MQSSYSNPPVSNSNPFTQASALSGFKFSTIGNSPSLLERMGDGPRASFRPSSNQNSSQVHNSTSPSHAPFRPTSPLPLRVAPVYRGPSVKPIVNQDLNGPAPASTSFSPFEPLDDLKIHPQPLEQTRTSVFPDLQYPNATPAIDTPLRESVIPPSWPVPFKRDASHQPQPPIRQSLPPFSASNPPSVESGVAAETTGSPAPSLPSGSSQHSSATPSAEPEQARRPVEHLLKIASAREEQLSKRREIFNLRSGELSTFGAEALQAAQDLQDRTETLKQQAEDMRAQAEQTLQEATKMRDMADQLISSAGTLGVDLLGAQVSRAVGRSEQLTRFVRKSFDWLATVRSQEQEKIAVVQAEIVEQDLADLQRRQQELQQQLERRKIEEQEKIEAAKREEQERETASKKAEEEREAARMRAYDIRRAEVMAEKRRATEAQAQSIQAEREKRIADASGSGLRPPTRSSDTPLSTAPAPSSEVRASADVPSSQVAPTLSRSPVIRTGGPPEITSPSSHSQPLPNKAKTAPAPVSFVPAQTEAGRAVNTDSPLSSTILASELHPRNVVEASRHSHVSQVTCDAQEEMQPQNPRQVAPPLELHHVQVKREPSVGALPRSQPQPFTDMEHTDQSQHSRPVAVLRTSSQGLDIDRSAPALSTSGSRATPSHVVQTDDYLRRADPPRPVPYPYQDELHLQDSHHDQVAPSTDGRAHGGQDSASSELSAQNWNYRDRRSPSRLSSREGRSRSRSPPHWRKRTRSRTPPRFEPRQNVDHWEPDRPHVRPRIDDDWDRPRRYNGYERRRRGDSPRRYLAAPRRGYNSYRPSRSPPPSPRQLRTERSPPRRSYYDRPLASGYVPQRFVNTDVRERRADEYRADANTHHNEPAVEAYRSVEKEEQQYQRQRRTPSPSERDQTSTLSPRQGEMDIGLLDRINMNEADDRGSGRGRVSTRGGPNARRGTRGVSSGGRGRGGALALLSRMSETTTRPARPAPALSLSDRMQQD
jgi:hypothetical protein